MKIGDFENVLELKKAEAQGTSVEDCPERLREDVAGQLTKPRVAAHQILSVDDDQVNQMVIENILRPSGYEVKVCMDGPEALAELSNRDYLPDLCLVDVMMPSMDGYEVVRKLRTLYPGRRSGEEEREKWVDEMSFGREKDASYRHGLCQLRHRVGRSSLRSNPPPPPPPASPPAAASPPPPPPASPSPSPSPSASASLAPASPSPRSGADAWDSKPLKAGEPSGSPFPRLLFAQYLYLSPTTGHTHSLLLFSYLNTLICSS
eukprot:749492-Hanusia_phi.AAC.2